MTTNFDEDKLFGVAENAYDNADYDTAFELFLFLANNGHFISQNNLANMYCGGIGTKKDNEKALYWYKKAAKNGDCCAVSNIGRYYVDLGNFRRAKFWFLKAIEMGDDGSTVDLAKIYLKGNRKADVKYAAKYLKIAIAYDAEELFDEAIKYYDKSDFNIAIKLFLFLAKNGDEISQNNLANMYHEGLGFEQDTKKALYWYKKAARRGYKWACANLGGYYMDLDNFKRAKFWLIKAIEAGDGESALDLAKIYLQNNRKINLQNAIKYLKIAASSKSVTPSLKINNSSEPIAPSYQEEANLLLLKINKQ